ncbi:hypothetical protein [Arthrobacter sp. HLT1-21]
MADERLIALDSKEFGQKLMYRWPMDSYTQQAFDNHAKELRTRFATRGSAVTKGARVDFRNYIDFLRVSQGLPEALARLEDLRESGLMPELYATAGMIAARRAGEYGQAADFLVAAHNRWRDHSGIFVFLIETLISADRVPQAVDLLSGVNRSDNYVRISRSAIGLKLGELASVCGAWEEVMRFAESIVPDPEDFAGQIMSKRAEMSLSYSGQTAELPAFVLNMTEDSRKLSLLLGLYRKFDLVPERREAVDGRALDPSGLPDIAAHRGLRIGGGALGCALGHISMWKEFLVGGQSHGLFLEDDGLPFAWQDLSEIIAKAGFFDVLYVNERMSGTKAGILSTGISALWDTLGTRPDSVHGWGADGYMLSREGADRLLDAVSADKVLGHIDGQIAAYGIPQESIASNLAQTIGLSVRQTSRYTPTLTIKCLDFPLVASMDFGDSTIGRVGGH